MYLLHTKRLELQQFFDDQIPPYAILSHTWGKEEPRLQDMHNDNIKRLHGYKKIEHAAKQAAQDGLEFVWIDTICIDKTSSAELSEAINSMFRWYAQSRVCYAYLEDVERSANFTESRWFTRGFTLQELLAPKQLVFYNKRWDWLGEKTTEYLVPKICMACGIFIEDQHVLTDFQPGKWSVATRMSWASTRQTTRREDIAYCLLGIFNINMPLLYGEGDRAFFRLQEEIMRVSDDRSLFAWPSLRIRKTSNTGETSGHSEPEIRKPAW
ncbi:HET-domain-containing protein [Lophiostoma macrostomum CBS 122681]|uniref:HET-domain-containing protein n=1 Tax=Lophiostoma macrostomum CBS 122681 TaxID=1314788 RepID=A0A6A6SVU7_9PLEO|nr:HET-domain-containing protein [Lophiostoma macrostomum CBS 122681]